MKTAMRRQDDRIAVIANKLVYQPDSRRAPCLGRVSVEAQESIPAWRRISSCLPGMNAAHQAVMVWVTAAVEPIVIPPQAGEKVQVLAVFEDEMRSDRDQGRMCK